MPTNPVLTNRASERARHQIRTLRQERELSHVGLAATLAEAGHALHVTALSRIESGARGISVDDAQAIADALDVPVSALLEEPSKPLTFAVAEDHEQLLLDLREVLHKLRDVGVARDDALGFVDMLDRFKTQGGFRG